MGAGSNKSIFRFQKKVCWVCTGNGEKPAFEKDGRLRGRPSPILPFVVSSVFAPPQKLHPGKRTSAHPQGSFKPESAYCGLTNKK